MDGGMMRQDMHATDCAAEAIHLTGAIQPHGYLVSCSRDWRVRHASANIEALLGVEPAALVGRSLRDHVAEEVLQDLADALAAQRPGQPQAPAAVGNLGPQGWLCHLTVHLAQDLVHVEIEAHEARRVGEPVLLAQPAIARLATAGDIDAFLQLAADQIRTLTGFARVMVYRFRHDDAGEVVAESREAHMDAYLGLRYPATDIPAQARALYLRNRLRLIPDAHYAPVPIVPVPQEPLDLSGHVLRSVSPVHLEYLRNMGVAASMSVSLICGDRLWGLIACHHPQPHRVSPTVRAACDFLGMFVSMRLEAVEQEHRLVRMERLQGLRDAMGARLRGCEDFEQALVGELDAATAMLEGDGAAAWLDGRWHARGRVPDAERLASLQAWLRDLPADAPLAFSDRAEQWAAGGAASPAGVMALRLGADEWLAIFRDEQVETVRWAGEPAKAVSVRDDGIRLGPRRSFAEWRQTVHGRSLPWTEPDLRGAERLQRLLLDERQRTATTGA